MEEEGERDRQRETEEEETRKLSSAHPSGGA